MTRHVETSGVVKRNRWRATERPETMRFVMILAVVVGETFVPGRYYALCGLRPMTRLGSHINTLRSIGNTWRDQRTGAERWIGKRAPLDDKGTTKPWKPVDCWHPVESWGDMYSNGYDEKFFAYATRCGDDHKCFEGYPCDDVRWH
jgi:hypothetical protein